MKFCTQCGNEVTLTVPEGDNRERFVCSHCHHIHYQNPRIVTGTLPVWEDQVLMCLRAIPPRDNYWTLPAGFMENGETVADGAARETMEEAHANVTDLRLYTVFSLPHISQVYMFYLARLTDPNFHAGEESLDVRLYDEADIPWERLAFPVIGATLKHFFADRKTGTFPVHSEDVIVPLGGRRAN
ncbi:MAG: NUDIX hydrolase [Pseudomonadota bacterium]